MLSVLERFKETVRTVQGTSHVLTCRKDGVWSLKLPQLWSPDGWHDGQHRGEFLRFEDSSLEAVLTRFCDWVDSVKTQKPDGANTVMPSHARRRQAAYQRIRVVV